MNDYSKGFLWTASCLAMCSILLISQVLNEPLVILALPLLIPIAHCILRMPIWGCLGFVVFSFFRLHEAVPALMPFRLPQLLALASLAVLAWHGVLSKEVQPYWHPLLTLLCIFFVFICLGAIFATDRGTAIGAIQGSFVKIITMVFAIAWLVRNPSDFTLATRFIMTAGLVIAVIALMNKANGIGLVEGTRVTIGRNIGSMIGDPNDLALVLTFPFSFAASNVFSPRSTVLNRLISAVFLALIASAILATQSRGGLLGMSAIIGSLLWRMIKQKWLVISIGGILLVLVISLAGISERSSGGASEEGIDASAMGRIYAWQAAISMAVHNPMTGVGINNFYANYYFHSPHWDGKNHAVHSTWFQVLAETGFVGLIIFTCLVVGLYKVATRSLENIHDQHSPISHTTARALWSGLIGFCISGTFLTQGFIWPLYILLALSIALNQFLTKEQRGISNV
jgi:probable O-glycosylation ligase (exosortase A-associated)